MSDRDDYRDEMARKHLNDELLDLLPTSGTIGGPRPPVAEFLLQLQSLGETPLDSAVVTRHVAMLADEAVPFPVVDPVTQGSTGPLLRRWRTALATLMSGFVLNALIGVAAFAAVGTGAVVAADGASPGDVLYGLDRALERVGINDGHAEERMEEAMALVDRGEHSRALEAVEEAIGSLVDDSANASALEALQNASDQIATVRSTELSGFQDTQMFRDQVARLLGIIATEVEDGTVNNGVRIAQAAREFSTTAQGFAESRGRGPDGGVPPGSETPPGGKPDTPGRPDQP